MTAVAATDLVLLQIAQNDLHWILDGTKAKSRIEHCARMRSDKTIPVMESVLLQNSFLRNLTKDQKLGLEMIATVERVSQGEVIWEKGASNDFAVLICAGRMVFPGIVSQLVSSRTNKTGSMMVAGEDIGNFYCPPFFSMGAYIGNTSNLLEKNKTVQHLFKLSAITDCVFYKIETKKLKSFLENNPGVLLSLGTSEFVT